MHRIIGHAQLTLLRRQPKMRIGELESPKRIRIKHSDAQQMNAGVAGGQPMLRMIVSTKLENATTVEEKVIVKPYAEHRGKTRHGPTRLMAVFSHTMEPKQRLEEQSILPEDLK